MKFEALHQTFKRYAKNSGFKNVGKTKTQKYQQRTALEFCGFGEFEVHPMLNSEIEVIRNKAGIAHVIFYGTKLTANKKIVAAFEIDQGKKSFGHIIGFSESVESLCVILTKFKNIQFDHNLLAYEIENSAEKIHVEIKTLCPVFGTIYDCKLTEKTFAIFDQMI